MTAASTSSVVSIAQLLCLWPPDLDEQTSFGKLLVPVWTRFAGFAEKDTSVYAEVVKRIRAFAAEPTSIKSVQTTRALLDLHVKQHTELVHASTASNTTPLHGMSASVYTWSSALEVTPTSHPAIVCQATSTAKARQAQEEAEQAEAERKTAESETASARQLLQAAKEQVSHRIAYRYMPARGSDIESTATSSGAQAGGGGGGQGSPGQAGGLLLGPAGVKRRGGNNG